MKLRKREIFPGHALYDTHHMKNPKVHVGWFQVVVYDDDIFLAQFYGPRAKCNAGHFMNALLKER